MSLQRSVVAAWLLVCAGACTSAVTIGRDGPPDEGEAGDAGGDDDATLPPRDAEGGPGCRSDADCDDDEARRCDGFGRCVECTRDGECDGESTCTPWGECEPTCDGADDCEAPEWCAVELAVCVECVTDADCSGEACVDGECEDDD